MTIYYHKHHKIPKHFFKCYPNLVPKNLLINDPINIELLTIEQHALAHKKLFEQYGKWQDELAWKTLNGQISNKEAIRLSQIEGGKLSKGRKQTKKTKIKIKQSMIGKNIGKKHVLTEEHKRKISESNKGKMPKNINLLHEKCSKEWLIINPNGDKFKIKSLTKFCKEHNGD